MTQKSPVKYTEQVFELEHLSLNARVSGRGQRHKVLALHGWLDNCASFNRLTPLIDNAHIVALDMAGHGLSGHRQHMAPYNIWEDIVEIFSVVDQLGWDSFSLLGHSRGAMVATIAAGTLPERVTNLILLDGIWPEEISESQAAEQLARSVNLILGPNRKRPTLYASREKALLARMKSAWPVNRDSAMALAERGLLTVDGGFIWRADPKLQLPSAVKLTRGQINAFIDAISAKVQLILAEDGVMLKAPKLVHRINEYPKIETVRIPGTHHFHMESATEAIAELVNNQLSMV